MKANAPEKIYIQPNAHDGWFESNPHSNIFVEYTRTDAFIEKVCEWLDDELCCYIKAQDFSIDHPRLNKDLRKHLEDEV